MVMLRLHVRCIFSLLALVAICGTTFAQDATATLRFRWTEGQALDYKVQQNTSVTETSIDEQTKKPVTVTTVTKLTLTKKWTAKSVDASGTATLELSITAMRQEVTQTVGEEKPIVKLLDSAIAEDAKSMTFLNKTAVTVKVDTLGQLLDTQSANEGAADRLQVELPFRITLPNDAVKVAAKWDRGFRLKLPPPLGTGEKLECTQTYSYKGMSGDFAVVGLGTELKTPPDDAALMPAVVPTLWTGDVFLNAKTGAYHGAKLTSKKDVANHQGEGTKFVYRSEYTEAAEK